MKKILLLALIFLSLAAAASAQTVVVPATAKVDFLSADNIAIIPAGQLNAGQPVVTSYQGSVFLLADDVVTGTPLIVGPVVPKALVTSTPTSLRLTFVQLGITAIPACTVVAPAVCPVYDVLLVAIGPNGTSAKAVVSESDSFTLAPLVLPSPPPAGPSTVRIAP